MNVHLLLQAAYYVERHLDHDYCNGANPVLPGNSKPASDEKSRLRVYHNELERKRRADLRDTLDILKKEVTTDEVDKRLSTVRVLEKAALKIRSLNMKYKAIDFETQKLQIELECLQEEIEKYKLRDERIKKWIDEQNVKTGKMS